ncbi:hypothetical protein [Chryseobacterium sp. SORGH_AS_1048]|uniref:hypothetical protein n=1 Tax=Chryseobacterium sp. SORGH_AS_1048 TaxID=3041783 RepID=UPI002789747B|nr:hypothetical protein [Chryseobacterium sp. SORGH_AS_1048]MDQ1099672.1 hypothetical protein [Chryseobacterium sp. SORGH_AS_1048]
MKSVLKIAFSILTIASLTSCAMYSDSGYSYGDPYYNDGYYYAPQGYYGGGGYWGNDGYYYRNDINYYYDNGIPYYFYNNGNERRKSLRRKEGQWYGIPKT